MLNADEENSVHFSLFSVVKLWLPNYPLSQSFIWA